MARPAFLTLVPLVLFGGVGAAQAQTGPAVDPAADPDFPARAARFRLEHPHLLGDQGAITTVGEVIVLQGDANTVDTDGVSWGIRWPPSQLMQRAIAHAGDVFESINVWSTFGDKNHPGVFLELTIKNDISGIGLIQVDDTRLTGSKGKLRSALLLKNSYGFADKPETWPMAIWGQESAHRWLIYMGVRDRRSGQLTDALLGRDCGHYSRFADTQASVMDGFAWTDNHDGSFTTTEVDKRYGWLDLYAMGLLAGDEMPSFFFIDDIPGYTRPRCDTYSSTPRPKDMTIKGTRVDVNIDDIVAANGERHPTADEMPGYFREAQVLLTLPSENAPDVRNVTTRLNAGRQYWEDWNLDATRQRLVICTQTTKDCGDPRSDVVAVTPSKDGIVATVRNTGGRDTTGVHAHFEAQLPGRMATGDQDIGNLATGASRDLAFAMDTADLACGTPIKIKVATQSDFHYQRMRVTEYVGTEVSASDDFEKDSGWHVNPDGTDDTAAARWERGTPSRTVVLGTGVQPDGAHTGTAAWVTGAGGSAAVQQGRTTLESPPFDATSLREPMLRYWMTVAAVKENGDARPKLIPSDGGNLTVYVRGDGADWVQVNRVVGQLVQSWTQRDIPLPAGLLPATALRFRFVAEDPGEGRSEVEAAIDDIQLLSFATRCPAGATDGGDSNNDGGPPQDDPGINTGGKGCGCRVGGAPSPGGAILAGVAGVVGLFGRRRRFRG